MKLDLNSKKEPDIIHFEKKKWQKCNKVDFCKIESIGLEFHSTFIKDKKKLK